MVALTRLVDLFIDFFFRLPLPLQPLPLPTCATLHRGDFQLPAHVHLQRRITTSTESNDSPALTVQTLSDALGNATLDEQIDMHPARNVVFATNKLLHLITSHVPRRQRFTTLLRVSKTWNRVIRKTGYYAQPANARANHSMSIPMYPRSAGESIDFHPIIHCMNDHKEDTWNDLLCRDDRKENIWNNRLCRWTMVFKVANYYPSVLHRFGHQYLISPPTTHLSLKVNSPAYRDALARLRVKDGIRLRDVAEVLDKLLRCLPDECQYVPESETHYKDFVFTAHVFCTRAGSEREAREREHRMLRFHSDCFPEYPETIPIAFNPVFGRLPHKPARSSREHYVAHYQVDHLFPTHDLRRLGDQFLTNPPITHLALNAHPAAASLLKVQDGIRLRDLAEALDSVRALNRSGDFGMFRRADLNVADFEIEHYEKCGGCVVSVHLDFGRASKEEGVDQRSDQEIVWIEFLFGLGLLSK
ncbi:hypothetical protein Q7P35_000704 [Cladosporium inversicolor]